MPAIAPRTRCAPPWPPPRTTSATAVRTRGNADGNGDGTAAAARSRPSNCIPRSNSMTRRSRSAPRTSGCCAPESPRARARRCRRFPSRERPPRTGARRIRGGDADADRFRPAGGTGRSRNESRRRRAEPRRRRPRAHHRRDLRLSARAANVRSRALSRRNSRSCRTISRPRSLSMPFTDERAQNARGDGGAGVRGGPQGRQSRSIIPPNMRCCRTISATRLQYASSSHAAENNLRALDAYDEALKVRTRETSPLEYANTIANRANCLWNLPDDPDHPEAGNRANLALARSAYVEAREIFMAHGELDKARIVAEAVDQIEREILALPAANGKGGHASEPPLNISTEGGKPMTTLSMARPSWPSSLASCLTRRRRARRRRRRRQGAGQRTRGDDGRIFRTARRRRRARRRICASGVPRLRSDHVGDGAEFDHLVLPREAVRRSRKVDRQLAIGVFVTAIVLIVLGQDRRAVVARGACSPA